ncbi:MAG: LysR family transcriptional regulator [Gammaproteobacteria bacterium]|nr:LysR family transcriptional regulator [Gammaproteobacteria bacterium]MDH5728995.1 LysR family transcriptional regulator [Gammaproteobacteria bacterium]
MENNQLLGAMQAFISVVENGSFSASARNLGLSQPTISRQINSLEEQLGVRLLQRTTRRLSLTEAGEIYYNKVRQIQRDVFEANLAVSNYKEKPSGVLRISAPHTWTEALFAPHLSEFLSMYPEIDLHLECNDQFQDVIEERLDLVIRVGVMRDSSYVAVPFGKIKMLLYATPAYLHRVGNINNVDDLARQNFILFEDFEHLIVRHQSEERVVTLRGNIRVNTVPMMISALRQHVGLTVLPDLLVKPYLQTGEVLEVLPECAFEIKNLPINQLFALYSNRKHLSAKARVFLDFFRQKILFSNI